MKTLDPFNEPSPARPWTSAVLIASAFFIATVPTLSWLEFSSRMENLVVATALETRRSGRWLIPALEGEDRIAKPPLAGWIAAVAIRDSTLGSLDSASSEEREVAYEALAWDVRWPALLASCAMLLAVFDLGKTLADARVGLISMAVCGSSLFLLRFGRQATTDVQLALWVAVVNAALARAMFGGAAWRCAIVAGVGLGLALMSKGPVALLLTIVPAGAFLLWRRRTGALPHIRLGPAILAAILAIGLGGAWYAAVAARNPSVWSRWTIEVARTGETERTNNPLEYVTILLNMLPWTPVFLHGAIWTGVEAVSAWRHKVPVRREAEGMILAWIIVLLSIVLMSFFPDRKDRYLLPLAGPASVLAARGVGAMLDRADRRRIPTWVMWATIAAIGIGLPIAGVIILKLPGGLPWYQRRFALSVIILVVAVIVLAWQASRSRPTAILAAAVIVMMILQPVFFLGYRNTREGKSELRPLAETLRRLAPEAQLYYWRPKGARRGLLDLSIYLNRSAIWVADPQAVGPPLARQVIVAQQHRGEAAIADPAGWLSLYKVLRDNDYVVAFFREAQ